MQIFTKQFLLESIKKENKYLDKKDQLPASYKSLQKYERLGIISIPDSMKGQDGARNWRLYTREEVFAIIEKLKEYKRKLNKHE